MQNLMPTAYISEMTYEYYDINYDKKIVS